MSKTHTYNNQILLTNFNNNLSWIDLVSFAIRKKLENTIGIEACFIYGSSQFQSISRCNDIDVFLISKCNMGLFWISIEIPFNPPLSITITDLPTLYSDIYHGKKAGFIINKFINPITPLINTKLILNYKNIILSSLTKAMCINNYFEILAWKDNQFPEWRKNHLQIIPNYKINPGKFSQLIFLDSPNKRGHWEVYRFIKKNWGQHI